MLEDPAAIRPLFDARQRTALLPFLSRGCTVASAAKQTGEHANTMLARVRRWQRLGLVFAVGRERHARGSQTIYRCTADAFFVPHRFTQAEDLPALAQSLHTPDVVALLTAYARAASAFPADAEWGIHFARQGERWAMQPQRCPETDCDPLDDNLPAALLQYAELRLLPAEAKGLQHELAALLHRFETAQSKENQGRTYHLFVGLA